MGVFYASYRGAQIALFNTFTSKVELGKRWDIEVPPGAWDCEHIPRLITSDRAELISAASDALPLELNVTAQVAGPYRPDMKGTIEGWFHDLKSGDIRLLVGYGRKQQRGDRDPRYDAALTRYDAMRAFIIKAIHHNARPAPVNAIPPEMMEDGYERICRMTLHLWGMRNLISGARIEDPRLVYTSLLKKRDASIREDGLYVAGIRYMSEELRTSTLLEKAARYGAIGVEAAIDEFAGRVIWYRKSLDDAWSTAYLADQKLLLYDATFDELVEYYRRKRVIRDRSELQGTVADNAAEQQLREISSNAQARQGAQTTKGVRDTSGVRAARAVDAEAERREHASKVLGSLVPQKNARQAQAPDDHVKRTHTDRMALVRKAFLGAGGGK